MKFEIIKDAVKQNNKELGISIKIRDRYSQYSKPSISVEILPVNDDDYLEDKDMATMVQNNIIIIDRRNVMTKEQHSSLLKIAQDFSKKISSYPSWQYAEAELKQLLKIVI